ncbi:hypothetical protein TNCV_1986321 [Trichonephila clavipes]|nr:hypothetical protein TNCV_1986321 [Trichonephila clavipes]
MACERKLLESEATTGFFCAPGHKGKERDFRMVAPKPLSEGGYHPRSRERKFPPPFVCLILNPLFQKPQISTT